MKVNGNDYNMESLLNDIDFNKNKLENINNGLDLTNYQISILKHYNIIPENYNSLKEIIYKAEEAYEETPDEELEIILDELSERNYYENTNK